MLRPSVCERTDLVRHAGADSAARGTDAQPTRGSAAASEKSPSIDRRDTSLVIMSIDPSLSPFRLSVCAPLRRSGWADRKRDVEGKSVSVRVDLGWARILKNKT